MKYIYLLATLILSSCVAEKNQANIKSENISDVILNSGSVDAKIQVYKSRLKTNSRDTNSLTALGKILIKKSKYKSAEKILSRAYDSDSSDIDTLIPYIKILIKNKKNKLVLPIINKYSKKNQTVNAEFFLLAGLSSLLNNQFEVANITFQVGILKYPENLKLKHYKTFSLLLSNKINLSIKHSQEILDKNYHQKKKIRQILIIANILKGNIEKAKIIALVDTDKEQVESVIKSYQKLTKLKLDERNKQLLKFADFLISYI